MKPFLRGPAELTCVVHRVCLGAEHGDDVRCAGRTDSSEGDGQMRSENRLPGIGCCM